MTVKRLMYFSVFISLAGLIGLYLSISAPQKQVDIKTENVIHEILVAKQEIKSGQRFSASLFEWKALNEDELTGLVDHIGKDKFDILKFNGSVLVSSFTAGHIMSLSDFLKPEEGGFLSVSLRPGYRAVSVPVDQVTANSGLVGPGDFVDVLLLASQEQELRTRGNETQSLYVKTIARNVRVLAFNDAVKVEQYIAAQKENKGFIPDDSAVTLEVLAKQANRIILANQLGILTLVLRSNNELVDEANRQDEINIADIFPDIKRVQPNIGLVEFRASDKRVLNQAGDKSD
ncbi:Flp pilus assembly protein CpaB [Shewanella psychropiezotolerans]|uniref:Flp pilus assembly protein CpaB n=1 Tax=Shewanella psychropiezotolerans TaxID=2593655 RepID=A0ABX5X7N8_9GAMM|nr:MULTISPECIES: Flp pilus assembly protein CpaB [Shewanella]MPY21080.1 Flp pilus assembly protein CpaB [Shewanella sp. YLB-07]MPY21867.1 Flp pilus assembly protein CpaB [Shewanella sp. YLB-07]QDO85251.1 Flp pilus assembly protein CpaB [Shewanella psychropiezotolerans]